MVYDWIKRFIQEHGYAPSYDEIRKGLGFNSLSTVYEHLKRLEEKGYIHSPWGNKKRAIEIIERGESLKLLGEVQAGEPIESYEVPEEVELPSGIFDPERHFALLVRGDSMVDEGILDGDIVVVRKSETAENGEVVVALVDGEATIKKYKRHGSKIELIPANPSYKPIVVKEEQVKIIGVVVALFRRY
ncbi:MAG: transcriptional repressor LexA [Candidatus Helarchaeota archaeon]